MKSLTQMTPAEFERTFGGRAARVLHSFLSGACTVAPAPGAFCPEVQEFFLALAAQATWAKKVAGARRAAAPKRAPKARPVATQPYAQEARGWQNPSPAPVRLADVAPVLKAVAPAAPAPRRTPPPAAECRRQMRIKAGVEARKGASAQARAQAAAAWLAAHNNDLPALIDGPEVIPSAAVAQ